jgi:DNA-binding beta-propeller fold protein YncE
MARVVAAVAVGVLALAFGAEAAFASGGSLGFLESDVDGAAGVDGLRFADSAAVSPDGKNVYVSSCADAAVAVFSRNASTGALSFVEADRGIGGGGGIPCAEDVAVSPDGANVYVSGIPDGFSVAVFSRDSGTGALTFREAESGGSPVAPIGVAVSPDGKNVYVGDYGDTMGGTPGQGGVVTYGRDSNGDLTFVESDGGLGGVEFIDISSDGMNVYVPALVDGTLTDFSRNPTTGALNPDNTYTDGAGGVNGLNGAHSVAVSHNGANVYVAALYDSSVATFARNSSTGALAFQGISAFSGAQDVVASPDDANIYAVSYDDNSVGSFSRNSTGSLGSLGAEKTGDPGIDRENFAGPWGLAASPDGKNVYVAALNSSSVATFARNVALKVTPSAKARQRVGSLKAKAECSLGCDLRAQAKVKAGKGRFKSKAVKETLFGDQRISFRLRFTTKMLKAIRRQLRHHAGTAAIQVNGAAGDEKKTATAKVRLRP